MLTEATLANIQRIELRDVWPSEPSDFTPWLADNISELGAALGMELELRQREADVGGYSLDIHLSETCSGPELVYFLLGIRPAIQIWR